MRIRNAIVLAALALIMAACLDLDTENPNDPDMASVRESPEDLQTLIATAYRFFFARTQQNSASLTASVISGSFGGGFGCFGTLERSSEPRVPITTVLGAGNQTHLFPWRDWYGAIAQVNTGLQVIRDGDVTIRQGGQDVTARARAFAKFVQGVAHGYVAKSFDQGYVFSDAVESDTLGFTGQNRQVQELLRPYPEVADTAIAQLEVALQIVQENNVSLPSETPERWISGYSLSSEEFQQVIHTYMARILAYTPRNPEEREAVDWERVLFHLDRAWQDGDFAPMGAPGIMQHNFQRLAARQRAAIPSDHIRPNYETIGVADQSGGFQEWWALPWRDRTPWVMELEDRRIVDPDRTPIVSEAQAEGLYLGQHIANVWAAERGTAHRTYYYFHRFGRGNTWETQPLVIISEAELDLLRAEAYIRLGQPEAAIPLINKTRVANGGLTEVTLDGVPTNANGHCTPRKWNGDCGSLWDALRWEFAIETMGTEGYVSWWNRRGWQELVQDTEIHWPMPLQDQELLEIPIYTVGGGQQGSAPAPDPERCPPAISHLPGCS